MLKACIDKILGENSSAILVHLKSWGLKGGGAMLDQGLFSGSNFILNILLARWLDPLQYGAFAIGFAVYLFLSGFHNALILEPISVLGTSRHSGHLKEYLASQVIFHFLLTGFISFFVLLVAVALLFFGFIGETIFQALAGVGFFLPFMLFIWLVRRINYILQNPAGSLQSTFFYFIFLSGFTTLLYFSPVRHNIFFWFGGIGLASFLGSVNIFFRRAFYQEAVVHWKIYLREQWMFGRWIVFATFLYSVGSQIQVFVIAFFLGLGDAGAFRAIQNFIMPMLQILAAFSILATPSVALEFGRGDFGAMRRKSFRISFLLIGVALCYELVLFWGSDWLEQFLYGGKYDGISQLLPVVGLVSLINAVEIGYSLILRSLQRPSFYIIDKAIVAIVGGVSAFVFVMLWSVSGAVLSLVVAECFVLASYVWLYRRWFLSMIKK